MPAFEGCFLANCAAHGIATDRFTAWKTSREISTGALSQRLGGRPARFVHIDSHHSRECLINDLDLVGPALHPDGVICLDDMLHPGYPMLAVAISTIWPAILICACFAWSTVRILSRLRNSCFAAKPPWRFTSKTCAMRSGGSFMPSMLMWRPVAA